MSIFGMFRGSAFPGLMRKGARWGAAPVLAAVFLGGIGSQASAAAASAGATGVGATSAVLRQIGSTWVTTVLMTGTASGCTQAQAAEYWLATTPYGVLGGPGIPGSKGTVTGTAPGGIADACEVTVTFSGLAHVPTTAALVVDQGGVSTSVRRLVDEFGTSDRIEKGDRKHSYDSPYFGWWLRSKGCGISIWAGVYIKAWAKLGHSPLWAAIYSNPQSGWTMSKLDQALSTMQLPAGARRWEDEDEPAGAFIIPLMLHRSAVEDDVIATRWPTDYW